MLEAKGPGFASKMDGPRDWQDWFTGDEKIEEQMERQAGAATGRMVGGISLNRRYRIILERSQRKID
jgi:hypothetical protein